MNAFRELYHLVKEIAFDVAKLVALCGQAIDTLRRGESEWPARLTWLGQSAGTAVRRTLTPTLPDRPGSGEGLLAALLSLAFALVSMAALTGTMVKFLRNAQVLQPSGILVIMAGAALVGLCAGFAGMWSKLAGKIWLALRGRQRVAVLMVFTVAVAVATQVPRVHY